MAWRKSANLSQREAARRAGVCQPTFSELESGRAKRVSVDTAMAIEELTSGAIAVVDWAGLGDEPAATPPPPASSATVEPSADDSGALQRVADAATKAAG